MFVLEVGEVSGTYKPVNSQNLLNLPKVGQLRKSRGLEASFEN